MIRLVIAALAAAILAAPAAAATATFDFTGGWGRSAATHSFSQDGLDLTVGGRKCLFGWCGNVSVQHWDTGFGIDTGFGDSHQIDGEWGIDSLSLAFSRTVSITALSLSYADSGDDVAIFRKVGRSFVSEASGPLTLLGGRLGSFSVMDGNAATHFRVSAPGWHDAFKLRGVTVSYDEPRVPPVPLPAAGWMLLAAIGGLAAARRRGRA